MKNNIQRKVLLLTLSSSALLILTFISFEVLLYILHHLNLLPLWLNKQLYYVRVRFGPGFYPAMFLVLLVSLFVFLIYNFLLSRQWSRNFEQIYRGTKEMASGNFSFEIPVYSKDELGELAANMNQLSDQLERALNEERKAVEAKNELVTNVSHDLRTPLTSIIGYLRLIDDDRYKDEVELRYFTAIAYEKSQRLERMVNDLFEYTRVNYGGLRIEGSEIDLIELLSQCIAQFIPLQRERGVKIQSHFYKDTLKIVADGDKLARVFENLIINGIKYGKEGKKIDLKAYMDGEKAVVEVVNYGTRIPQADLPYIFDRFYRVEKSRSASTGGSGLGLAISKGIVELHKGTIVASSTDKETIFRVTLPVR